MARTTIKAAIACATASICLIGTAQAQAGDSDASASTVSQDDIALFATVQELLRQENRLTLDHGDAVAGRTVKATARAAAKLEKRRILKSGVRQSNRAAGMSFPSVESSFVLKDVLNTPTGGKTIVLEESTRYPLSGGQDYEYGVEHSAGFENTANGWALTDLTTDSQVSEVGDPALAAAGDDPRAHVAAGVARVRQAKVALDANRGVLRAIDESKMADRSAGLTDDAAAVEVSALARPSNRPARMAADALTAGPGKAAGDGLTPYEYSTMVSWALKYSKDTAATTDAPVTYTRDKNDCTTFVSWALWKGGWAERGQANHSYFSVDNDDVWYWLSSDGWPYRHSYTWGGAINWARFAQGAGRVRLLSYTTDLSSAADVMQMEIDGYGSDTLQDHTMITTGRDPSGWVYLSYHSADTRNKPLNQILSANNGPYWAWRT